MRPSAHGDRAAVRRAHLRIAVITGAIITLLITVAGGVAGVMLTHAQDEEAWRELRHDAAHDDLSSPSGCTWLYAPSVTPLTHAPAGFPLRADLDRVSRTRQTVERTVRRDHTVYLVHTRVRVDGNVVQAVFDMRLQLADRDHLWFALCVVEVVGLIAAALTGAVVGRLAVSPLAEALARQRRFVTDASHELRTPVTLVYTRAQLLSRRAAAEDLPAPYREGLTRLAGSAGRLGEVLDDLLLSASFAAGPAQPPERRPVDLVALARSVVAEESDRTRDGRLTVTVAGPPTPLFVDGIESALRRAVGELLSNAISHTPAGGRIEVALTRAGGTVELTVTDTGPGFDPAEAERLFERFHSSGDGGRYGLGLALLREVVTHHGGTILAAGRPGRGARFTVRLPESGPRPASAPPRPGGEARPGGDARPVREDRT